ncbi:MAG: LamG-like jellyroll fold domain-containing protein [Clostridia bacterium]
MKIKKLFAGALSFAMFLSQMPNAFADENGDTILRYDFESEITLGESYGAEIKNGYAYFDGVDDYIHMPDNLVSGCENVTFVINVRPEMDGANQFTFTVGTSENNYLFLNTNNGSNCRFAMTNVGWWQEEGKLNTDPIQKGDWASVAIVMEGKTKKMYVDGALVDEVTSDIIASSLGDTDKNYLAKSQYANDSYFKGYIEDFRVYDKALTSDEVSEIANEHDKAAKRADVYIASESLNFDTYKLTNDIILPSECGGIKVTWQSGDESVLSNDGIITRYDIDRWVTLTATFTDEWGNSVKREYGFTVIHNYTDEEIAQMDLDEIHLVGNLEHLKENLYLTKESKYGSTITWFSEDDQVITNEGEITRAVSGGGDKSTKLWVFSTYNGATVSKSYDITVEEEDYAYLFAYFTGNRPEQERMFYGLSRDGYHFNTINNGNSVLESTKGHMCMRDPYIMKGQNGLYYALFTDMRSWDGWASQSSIIIFESEDLIHWDDGTIIDFNDYGWYNRAWAPQAIWDPEFYDKENEQYGAYMIYLALSSGGNTQMYKVYSRDMKTLITSPELLYRHDEFKDDIDSDIIYKDGLYYMYVKDETDGSDKGIYVVTSEHAGGPYSDRINALPRKDLNGNDVAIEGSGIFKLMNEDKYHLVYDAYNNGFFIMTETEDLVNFNQLDRKEYSFDFTPRHGYVITISKDEVTALQEAYGNAVPENVKEDKEPILYYDFEDESDKSGNFYNVQLSSSAAFAQSNLGGKGLLLNGTSESFATIPSECLEGLEDYTISAWFKTDNKNITQRVFDFGTGTNRYMFFSPYYGTGLLRGAITVNSHTMEKGISVEKDIETGTWTHVVMMQQGDVMRIYIDGVLLGETENVRLDPYEIQYKIPYCYIGKSQWSNDRYFDGMIDEFRIYNRAISEEEVIELYNMDVPKGYYVEETAGEFVLNYPASEYACVAVIAQYNEDGSLSGAKKFEIEKNTDYRFAVEKTGSSCKVIFFESMESLKPIN